MSGGFGFAPSAGPRLRLVFVRGLVLQALLGVHPHEKTTLQRVVIGVELAVEDDAASTGVGLNELRRVVDYEQVVMATRAFSPAVSPDPKQVSICGPGLLCV